MQTEHKTKSFAFKLAVDAKQKNDKQLPWQVRDGVAISGCTGPDARGNKFVPFYVRDGGYYC